MEDEYIIVVKGRPEGPYTLEQLKQLRITAGTFVKTKTMDDYKEAHELPELCEILGIKPRIRKPQYFASLDLRLLAVIIDYFLVFAVYCILASIAVLFLDDRDSRIMAAIAGLAIVPVAKMVYAIAMEASPRQGSYGKVLVNIKVCDESGSPLTLSRSIIRNLSKLICVLTLGIGFLYGFFDKRQQGLHDKIAGTLVIKDRLI